MSELDSTSQSIRDLHWVVTSPSLICEDDQLMEDWPDDLVINQDKLDAFLCKRSSHRVGYYFESLIHYWLRHQRQVEIVGQRLQIHEENRTIGELDFLFNDEHGRLNHWEVAVKFYLYHPDLKVSESHFIGPNAADTFERKMERLFHHQLPLSETYFPETTTRRAFVKGRLFYHPQMPLPENLPHLLTTNHLRGIWIYAREASLLKEVDFSFARILKKPFWLASESHSSDEQLLSGSELNHQLSKHFEMSQTPLLISLLTERAEMYTEVERVFVVNDEWP